MKRRTKQDLECENARLRAEIEGYKAALKIATDYAELMRLAIPRLAPVYVPYVQPVYPWPYVGGGFTWTIGDNVTAPSTTEFKVTS